jgi:hypothetical protein
VRTAETEKHFLQRTGLFCILHVFISISIKTHWMEKSGGMDTPGVWRSVWRKRLYTHSYTEHRGINGTSDSM